MSKILYVCQKNREFKLDAKLKLQKIADCLVPDNIDTDPEHDIFVKGHTAYAISMHKNFAKKYQDSILLGFLYNNASNCNWWIPASDFPDGSYALFRSDEDNLEIVSDPSGSRTIWYFKDDEYFIASTSQRAIIMFLGNFMFDDNLIPWMLSTGTLGPELSWDKRLQRLQADSSVILDKKKWEISDNQNTIEFKVGEDSIYEYENRLRENISQTIQSLKTLDFKKWLLPLSGGYDSRIILGFVKEFNHYNELKTVTWGLRNSLKEDFNDAKIARELASFWEIHHEFYSTDISSEDINNIIERFLSCGEGRIDHISAYMDGLEIWRKLYDEDIIGIIRGDEGFGWGDVTSELSVRLITGCQLCYDFKNLNEIHKKYNLPKQVLPKKLQKKQSESLDQWRDRLYHSYRLPTILAALSDIKYSYVEIINPLLSRAILRTIREIPDEYRTNKSLFKKIVNTISPEIPYAQKEATALVSDIFHRKDFIELIKDELRCDYSKNIFDSDFLINIIDGLNESQEHSSFPPKKNILKNKFKSLVPNKFRNWLRDQGVKPVMNTNKLAFRVYMVIKMNKIINSDINEL